MKKKILTAVLSMVLCLGMSTSVFAASSVTGSTQGSYATVNGQQIEVQVSEILSMNEVQKAKADNALFSKFNNVDWSAVETEEEVEAISNEVYTEFIKETIGVTVSGVETMNIRDIKAPAGVDMSAGVPITFEAPGIAAGDNVIVIHLTDAGEWENIPAVAGDGVITGTFTSLSPVFYFEVTGVAAETSGSEEHYHSYAAVVVEPTETTWGYTMYSCGCGYNYASEYVAPTGAVAATSPKTADSAMPAVAMLIAFVSVAGIAVVSRRKACVR